MPNNRRPDREGGRSSLDIFLETCEETATGDEGVHRGVDSLGKELLRDYIEFADGARMATAGVRVRDNMDKAQYASARVSSLAKMLSGSKGASSEQMTALLCGLLEAAGLEPEQRLELLGGAFVAEAVRPHWHGEAMAERAHDALRLADCELADAVEALAQVLLGRAQTRDEAVAALEEFERILAKPHDPPASAPQLKFPGA